MPPVDDQTPFVVTCLSCGREITRWYRHGVPSEIEVCSKCWKYVPVAERIKIQLMIRDRQPGGVFSELAEFVIKSIEGYTRDCGDGD